MLDDTAPLFFKTVKDAFWKDLIIGIASLGDPARDGKFYNISLSGLLEQIPIENRSKDLMQAYVDFNEAKAPFVLVRNKHLAHQDREHVLGIEEIKPLPTLDMVEGALNAVAAFLNEVEHIFVNSSSCYPPYVSGGDASALLYLLKLGNNSLEEQRRTGGSKALGEEE